MLWCDGTSTLTEICHSDEDYFLTGSFPRQKTLEEAEEYFQRRAAVIKDNVDKGTQALVQRRHMYDAVTSVLQQKMAAAQAQGAS